ncbi:MAG: hypothetical protein QXU40_03590 [Candidatus Pacearchaeota archaeon]
MLKPKWIKNFLWAFIWGLSIIIISILIYYWKHNHFEWSCFLQFDAVHYYKIVHLGYNYKRSAFFPLFPWIWKFLGGNITIGIILNIFIFSITFAFISEIFQLDTWQKWLFLSIPSSIFYCLPYSESIFALSSIFLIYTIIEKKDGLTILSFVPITLARPAFIILLPALAIYFFFQPIPLKRKMKIFIFSMLVSLLTLVLVNFYQYSHTQINWGFFSAQQTYWDNRWRLPHFPLSSYGDNYILRIDHFCFFLGLSCIVLLILRFIHHLRYNSTDVEPYWTFIYSYIAGISLLVLFTRGGSLFSLNRFVLTTIFGGMFIVYFPKILRKHFIPIITILILLIILNGYLHIRLILNQLPLLILFILFYFYEKKWVRIILITLFTVFQLFLMQKFMEGEWVA